MDQIRKLIKMKNKQLFIFHDDIVMKKIKAKQLLEPIIIIPKEPKICNNKNINIFNSDSLHLIKAWINKLCVYDVKYNNRKEYAVEIHNNISIN